MMRGQPAPVEEIVSTDWLATAINHGNKTLRVTERIVILRCGHREVTRNARRCKCTACHQMILNGEDYEKFNRSVHP
jgi:hypothetical protein